MLDSYPARSRRTAANEVLTALERGGIEACKTRDESNGEAFIISVPKVQAVRALQILQSLGLPRGRRAGFGEVYKQASLVPTPTEERARYLEALAGEIERTLETVDGVVTARVHLVFAEPDPLAMDGRPRVAAQAAVLLKVRPTPPGLREADVQKLVAGSVAGLAPERWPWWSRRQRRCRRSARLPWPASGFCKLIPPAANSLWAYSWAASGHCHPGRVAAHHRPTALRSRTSGAGKKLAG